MSAMFSVFLSQKKKMFSVSTVTFYSGKAQNLLPNTAKLTIFVGLFFPQNQSETLLHNDVYRWHIVTLESRHYEYSLTSFIVFFWSVFTFLVFLFVILCLIVDFSFGRKVGLGLALPHIKDMLDEMCDDDAKH